MKNLLSKIWTEISNHNRYKSIAIVLCCAMLVWFQACSIKCNSILHPGTQITGEQLQMEVNQFYAQAVIEANSIAKQELLRSYLWQSALTVASGGAFNWMNFLMGAGTLIGAGAVTDNIRYRIKFPETKTT